MFMCRGEASANKIKDVKFICIAIKNEEERMPIWWVGVGEAPYMGVKMVLFDLRATIELEGKKIEDS